MSSLYCSQGHNNQPGSRFCSICGEKLQAVSPKGEPKGELPSGTILGQRYQITRLLGVGGFGRTYLATDQNRFNEICVLKEFAPQVEGQAAMQKAEELFEREAGILYQLRHPQIPRFRELLHIHLGGHLRLFLVQDYVEGQTYQQLLETRRTTGQFFSEAEVIQLLTHLLPVLHYIHSQGVVHRDISPDNLILRTADQLPVLIDFGGVKQIAASLALHYGSSGDTVTRLGKVGYAPAEQMDTGKVSPASDLYALAVTLLVLLSGREPSALGDLTRGDWKRQVKLSPQLQSIVERMLGKDPRSRFTTAEQVLQALPGGAALPSPPVPPVTPAPSPSQIERTRAIAPATPTPARATAATATVSHPAASAPPVRRQWNLSSLAAGLATVVLVGGVASATWATRNQWIPLLFGPRDRTETPNPEPSVSSEEQARKATISARRQELGVDTKFLIRLTDDTFYRRNPEMAGRSLSQDESDAQWREQWDGIALEWLEWFDKNLSSAARKSLGSYDEGDRTAWKREVNRLNVSSRALNDLADARFYHAFPEWRDQKFIDEPIGQVWQAITFDQLQALKGSDRLTRIRFSKGEYSESLERNLKAGEGQVYIVDLKQGQPVRVNLEAPSGAALLSLYLPVPTQELPVLLEDSSKTQWSGELPQSGIYEIVVVADGDREFNYTLNLAADEVSTEPIEEILPSPDADLDLPIAPGN
ncbi:MULTISPECIES: serine/threonine-protein kinase [unclassified Leptolyngbya]|uniref:serine/threonine-protein kinase n=1 Tax=unclassified Leptolyngbya TaxID=2650499 RepID=UPI00168951D3|nr:MULTISPECIES: serine/threonine-protein kinase [unclassified Leptolyngbya]MBD1910730.1 protein kinase [Leptolyngbya sp. FACHB-8]MBD2158165.1 protein kinase [Leptolyngbya sp. FACHB-16]